MIGSLLDRWEYTWTDIWEPLGSETDAPVDLYIELYRTVLDFLIIKPDFNQYSELSSDPENALEAFRSIQSKDFKGEISAISFIESAYETIDEIGVSELLHFYVILVGEFIERYNLRYILVQPFGLRVQLPWFYADIYKDLHHLNQGNSHLMELMDDFEHAFNQFVRTRSRRDLGTSIAKASNYAEGVAAATLNSPGSTLGRMCDVIDVWPHNAVRESIKNLYNFCSDYPAIRHAGNPNNKLRELEEKDTIIISALIMAFTGYMHSQIPKID